MWHQPIIYNCLVMFYWFLLIIIVGVTVLQVGYVVMPSHALVLINRKICFLIFSLYVSSIVPRITLREIHYF
jgi:hypothetical protein